VFFSISFVFQAYVIFFKFPDKSSILIMKVYIGVFQHLLCIPSVCDIIEDYFDIFSALVFLVSEIVKINN